MVYVLMNNLVMNMELSGDKKMIKKFINDDRVNFGALWFSSDRYSDSADDSSPNPSDDEQNDVGFRVVCSYV